MIQSHPEAVDDIQEKCTELNTAWSSLVGRADQRKDKLGNSHDLQRFLSDFRWGRDCWIQKCLTFFEESDVLEICRVLTDCNSLLCIEISCPGSMASED